MADSDDSGDSDTSLDILQDDRDLSSDDDFDRPLYRRTPRRFRCHETIVVRDVAKKFREQAVVTSREFFCQHDNEDPPSFQLVLTFGKHEGYLSACIKRVKKDIGIRNLEYQLFDDQKFLDKDSRPFFSATLEDNKPFGWENFYKPKDPKSAGVWWIVCQFTYETLEEFEYDSDDDDDDDEEEDNVPSSNRDQSLPVQNDLLKLLENQTNADVTFSVQGEKIKAHKLILLARSEYFANMFKSEMVENITNEVEVPDVDPLVFKGLLEYLYSGKPPKNLYKISLDLLVVADKYGMDEVKDLCMKNLYDRVSDKNVVDALLVAHKLGNEDLMSHAKTVFRGWSDFFRSDSPEMEKLKACPELLVDLMLEFSKG